jgi:hypothetical protein
VGEVVVVVESVPRPFQLLEAADNPWLMAANSNLYYTAFSSVSNPHCLLLQKILDFM